MCKLDVLLAFIHQKQQIQSRPKKRNRENTIKNDVGRANDEGEQSKWN